MSQSLRAYVWSCIVIGVIALAAPLVAKDVITLGVTGDASSDMGPVLRHLNASPNLDVQVKVFPNHDELYNALKEKKVDLAFLGAVKYVEAHFAFGATPIVAEGPSTRSFIGVPAGSPIKEVAQLKGKRFAFGYEDSTTTHLIPALLLSKHGIKETDLKTAYLGHYPQKLVDETLAGKYDACAMSELTYAQNKSRMRPIEESDPFPGPPIVARVGLPEAVRNELRQRWVSYKAAPADRGARFGKGAVAVSDTEYNRIRFLCKVLFNKMYQ